MHRIASSISLACGLLALVCGTRAIAQDSTSPSYNQVYENAVAQAEQKCNELWSDHVFDPLRDKIPLYWEKPTFQMLTNTERFRFKDKPLGDLAMKTLEKCRSAWSPVYSMLPSQVSALIHGVEREQDAQIAELYNGKITFGAFNVEINRLAWRLAEAVSGIKKSSEAGTTTSSAGTTENNAQKPPSLEPRPKAEERSIPIPKQFLETRLALVIGNSNYANLPKLSNPANDAHSIADVLQKLGYKTQLLLDASDQNIRSEVRKFASESSKAAVALVYYAGHGAQLNGNNYLLPVDIDIPRTEADIQFSGLKVDDLVNSIGSGTKIVFLDACRDNPALFKNLVSGRGSSPVGLAPATASNFTSTKPGGGVFIAYATDAGAIADDGHGAHSPFTQALLRYIQKPVSIDDMFSLVTREVRLVTKNMQRPYKYASLESIVCLTPACSNERDDVKPLLSKKQYAEMKFSTLASTPDGNGEILYQISAETYGMQNAKAATVITRFFGDQYLE
jgi:Caspase domain